MQIKDSKGMKENCWIGQVMKKKLNKIVLIFEIKKMEGKLTSKERQRINSKPKATW